MQVVGYAGVPPSQMRPGSRFPLQSLTRALLFLSICFTGCEHSEDASRLRLTVDEGPFALGDTVRGSICVSDTNAVFTQYFIISEADTFRLPLERGTKCATYEVLMSSVGTKEFHGFARMEMSDDRVLFEPFTFTHRVE